MATIRVTTVAGADGVVRLAIPVGEAGGEYDVVVTPTAPPLKTPAELAWHEFLDKTYGSIDDDTFVRPPQPVLEHRLPLE